MIVPAWLSAQGLDAGWKAIRLGLLVSIMTFVVAIAVVQTIRLEGFRLGPFGSEGALARADRLEDELGRIVAAQHAAGELAQAQKAATEETYRARAKGVDDAFKEGIGAELAAAARYAAANRVRCPAAGSPPGDAVAAAGSDGTGGPAGSGRTPELDASGGIDAAHALVAVRDDDVRICTENTLRLEAAQAWGIALEAASAAEGR